jgi:hypothetical protein
MGFEEMGFADDLVHGTDIFGKRIRSFFARHDLLEMLWLK